MLWHREYTRESSHLRVSERPENKQRWIIDEEAAAVVRRIFRMVNDGKGVYQIADILSEEKVLCPSAYLAAKGVGNRRNSKFEDPYRWWGTTVSYILARRGVHGAYRQFQDLTHFFVLVSIPIFFRK
jgi:site-specific DNA recombinase